MAILANRRNLHQVSPTSIHIWCRAVEPATIAGVPLIQQGILGPNIGATLVPSLAPCHGLGIIQHKVVSAPSFIPWLIEKPRATRQLPYQIRNMWLFASSSTPPPPPPPSLRGAIILRRAGISTTTVFVPAVRPASLWSSPNTSAIVVVPCGQYVAVRQ